MNWPLDKISTLTTEPFPRGGPRQTADSYLTHPIVARGLSDYIPGHKELPKGVVIEPSAGAGSFVQEFERRYDKRKVKAVEIDKFFKPALKATKTKVYIKDFLKWPKEGKKVKAALVAGNPPFKLAVDFVKHGLEITKYRRGVVAFLLKGAFFESQRRYKFNSTAPLSKVLFLVHRPPFIRFFPEDRTQYTDNGTDQAIYSLCIWDWRHEGPATVGYIPTNWRREIKEYKKSLEE